MNKSVAERIRKGLAKFRTILELAIKRDVSESDTVLIIHDMLAEIFGWDKYAEVTTEFEIRGTYCDLAIKHEGKLKYLIEVKAINNDLKENHVRQAVNYASNEGCEWVMLTNGVVWNMYQVRLEQSVVNELVFTFDITDKAAPKDEFMAKLYTICKEAVKKEAIEEFAARKQLINKYTLCAIITSPALLGVLRREIKRIKKDLAVAPDEIKKMLMSDVVKREIVESEKLKEANKLVKKASSKKLVNKRTGPQRVESSVSTSEQE